MTARRATISLSLEDGTDLSDKVDPRFVSASLKESRAEEADKLDIVLDNSDGLLAVPVPGRTLVLAWGWLQGDDDAGLVAKGRFTVDEVSEEGPPDRITLRARSADLTGDLGKRRTQSWKDTTLDAILREIATRHGRTASIEAGLAALPIHAIEQEGKSDKQFVRDLGRRYDAVSTWKDGKLVFLPIGASASASGTPLASVTLTKRDGWRWSFRQEEGGNHDGAEAQWHDADAGRRRTVKIGEGKRTRKLKRVYASEGEAQQAADAAAKRATRAPWRFTYDLAIADPALQPDVPVALRGWSERVTGRSWIVKEVTTTFDAGGLKQAIELESVG